MDSPFDNSMKSDVERAKIAALEARRNASRATTSLIRDLGQVRSVAERSLHTDVENVKEKLSLGHIARRFPMAIAVAGFAGGYLLSRALSGSPSQSNSARSFRPMPHSPAGSSLSSIAGLWSRSRGMIPEEVSGQIRGIVATLATQALTAFVAKHFDHSTQSPQKDGVEPTDARVIEERPFQDRPRQALPLPHSHHH